MLYICIFPGLKGNHIHPKQSWVAYFGALQSAGIGTKHGLLSVRTPLMNTRVSSALPDTFYSALGVALESKGTQSKQQPNLSAPHRLSSALLCASVSLQKHPTLPAAQMLEPTSKLKLPSHPCSKEQPNLLPLRYPVLFPLHSRGLTFPHRNAECT